ncbi:MAG: dihydrofolate reductase family protein [Gaiellaceae bacterium]
MTQVKFDISTSLDGYIAGPDPDLEQPLGAGGEQLHDWAVKLAVWREQHRLEGGEVNADTEIMAESIDGIGAYVMGRGMFGGGQGSWGDEPWSGWWGEEPPFHAPVFVVTHHARAPLPREGGTTFHFVTESVEAAVAQAQQAAGEGDVLLAGGASVIQQALRAGLVDEFQLHVAPVLLGGGTPLFAGLGPDDVQVETVRVVESPSVAHLKYRVVR